MKLRAGDYERDSASGLLLPKRGGPRAHPRYVGGGPGFFAMGIGGASDPHFSSVQFLSGFEGANGGTAFTDESSHARSVAATTGVPTTSTVKFKYGNSALRLAGSQILGVGVNTDWSWMHQAGAFWTWEGFLSLDDFLAERTLFSTSNGSTSNSGIYCGLTSGRGFDFQVYNASGNTGASVLVNTNIAAGAFPNDTVNFYHTAIQWDITVATGNLTIYVAGSLAGTVNKTANAPNASAATAALKLGGFGTTGDFKGYMDEVRLTQSVIRYSSGFTPPTGPFPRS